MTRALLLAVLAGGLVVIPGEVTARPGDDGPKGAELKTQPKPAAAGLASPGLVKLLDQLHNTPISLPEGVDLQTTPLADVLRQLAKQYDVTFVVDNRAFENPRAVVEARGSNLSASRLEGLTLGRFLDVYLRGLNVDGGQEGGRVAYLVRDYGIEITSAEKARDEAGLTEAVQAAGETADDPTAGTRARARLNLPLVSVVVDDRPLGEVLKEVARAYDLNLVLDRPVRERAAKESVSARLLNVPADTALELLAGQVGLEVVRKGSTFRIVPGNVS